MTPVTAVKSLLISTKASNIIYVLVWRPEAHVYVLLKFTTKYGNEMEGSKSELRRGKGM